MVPASSLESFRRVVTSQSIWLSSWASSRHSLARRWGVRSSLYSSSATRFMEVRGVRSWWDRSARELARYTLSACRACCCSRSRTVILWISLRRMPNSPSLYSSTPRCSSPWRMRLRVWESWASSRSVRAAFHSAKPQKPRHRGRRSSPWTPPRYHPNPVAAPVRARYSSRVMVLCSKGFTSFPPYSPDPAPF